MNEEKTPFIENLNKQQTSAYHQLYDDSIVRYKFSLLSTGSRRYRTGAFRYNVGKEDEISIPAFISYLSL